MWALSATGCLMQRPSKAKIRIFSNIFPKMFRILAPPPQSGGRPGWMAEGLTPDPYMRGSGLLRAPGLGWARVQATSRGGHGDEAHYNRGVLYGAKALTSNRVLPHCEGRRTVDTGPEAVENLSLIHI